MLNSILRFPGNEMRLIRRLPLCFAACLSMASVMSGQTSAVQPPLIRVTSRLLQVSVVVHDSKGEPVTDLTKDDFVLFDKGQRQEIRYFGKEGDDPLPEDLTPPAEQVVSNRFVTVQVDGKTRLQPLPNSGTAILLDGLNTRFADRTQARKALIQVLMQLRPGDRVAVYALTESLRVLQDFTADVSSLLAALNLQHIGDSAAVAASSYADSHVGAFEAPELDDLINRGNAMVAGYTMGRRAQTTLLALQAIANHLGGLPGRKNLIWLSGGFPIPPSAVNGGIINDAGMVIYPVDLRGLISMNQWQPTNDARTPSVLAIGPQPMDERADTDINASLATMHLLADRTGGRAFTGNNDIAGSIRRAMDDARLTYILYYAPSHNQWDGRFREIKIKLNRPGLEAHYRQGYYATPDPPADRSTRQSAIASVAVAPLPATGLTILARLLEEPTAASPRATLLLVLDGHEFRFDHNDQGRQCATVDLALLVFGDAATPTSQARRTASLVLTDREYDDLMHGGVRVTMNVNATVKSQRLRVVARDTASGRVGSVDVLLK
jgi:VWFA-related protein